MKNSPRKRSPSEPDSAARVTIARVLSSIIFVGLIVVLLATPIPYGSVEPWSQSVFQCSVFVLGFLWCLHGIATGTWFAGDSRLFWPLVATVAFAVLQSLSWSHTNAAGIRVANAISADPFETWIFAIRLAALVLAGVLATRFAVTPLRLRVLVNTVILIALLSAAFGIVRLTMQHGDGFLLASLPSGGGFAQFINKNHFAFLIEPAIGLLAALVLFQRDAGHRKLLYVSAIILLWAALIMSRSRGGLLAVAVQMIAVALLFTFMKLRAARAARPQRARAIGFAFAVILGIAIVVTGTTVWLGGDQLTTGVETAAIEISRTDNNHLGARRSDIWRATLQMARAHLITGAGLGGYWAEIPVYHDASGVLSPQQAHNDYLELFASSGIVGLGLLIWFIVALARATGKILRSAAGLQRVFGIGAIVGLLGVGVHSLVDFGLHITANALVFVVLLALISISSEERAGAQEHRSRAFSQGTATS